MTITPELLDRLEKLLEEDVLFTNRDIFDERQPTPQSSGGTPFSTVRPPRLAGTKSLNQILRALNQGLREANASADAGISASTTVFVYRPGTATTSLTPNVFNDWATLMAALALSAGPKQIRFDDTAGIIAIPAGTYDLADTTLRGFRTRRYSATPVNLDDGVVFQNLTELDTIHLLGVNTIVPLFSVPATPTNYNMYTRGARLDWSGAAPMFSVPAGQILELDIAEYTTVLVSGGAGQELIEILSATSSIVFAHGHGSSVSNDAVRGPGTIINRYLDGSGSTGTTQTNHSGAITNQFIATGTVIGPGTLAGANWGGTGVPLTVEAAIDRIATAVSTGALGPIL